MTRRLIVPALLIVMVTIIPPLIASGVDAKISQDDLDDKLLDRHEERKLQFDDTLKETTSTYTVDSSLDRDTADQVGPVGIADEYTDTKAAEIEAKHQDLQEIHQTINEEFNTTNSSKKILELKLDYIQTVNELNALLYIEPERDYLAEWTSLDTQVVALEELQYSNYTESRQVLIDSLYEQMNEIEQDSIASLVLDPADKKRLYDLESKLRTKYSNPNHEIFVSDEFVYVDHEQKKVYLLIDKQKTLTKKDISSIVITQDILNTFGIDNVTIDFAEITILGCNSITSDCDPLIGGISIGRKDALNDHSGTIGFRAKDSNGNAGFVTAGHVVQYKSSTNTVMHQPHTGTSVIGTIPRNGDDVCATFDGVDKGELTRDGNQCDFAFVKLARGVSINDDIYKSPNRTYDINELAIASDHVLGTMLKVVGSNSGVHTSSITIIWPDTNRVSMSLQSVLLGGDSGGPVFKPSTSSRSTSNAEVFGVLIFFVKSYSGKIFAYYEPVDKIMSELNLRPYH